MKDEIKEILDYLKDDKWHYYPSDMQPYKVFLMQERDILLDYITNLEQKVNGLQEERDYLYNKLSSECNRLKKDLIQKELCESLLDECDAHNKYLQDKIDKAVEIYKNRSTCTYKERFMEDKSTSDLMYETLTGGDNNE